MSGKRYRFFNGLVTGILDETANVKRFFIRIPELQRYDFHAGQFTMLDLPILSKVTTRSYSIASPPSGTNEIELVIVLKDGGLGTAYLFGEIRVGSFIRVSEPVGKFTRPRPEGFDSPLIFVCTGTGIAPFRSMILDILAHKVPFRQLILVKGCRTKQDILYHTEMQHLSETVPGFRFIPVLSRPDPLDWQGETGYVHPVYLNLLSEYPDAIFYLCGWKAMVQEARSKLAERGVPKDRIRFELYD
jgi:CDP-4-dehydro-6-deoxyglucose reductase